MLINLDGNIVNRFGDRFPVPFMEKIVVNNNSFEIDVSLYFLKDSADEGDNLWEDYIDSLSTSLQYSVVMVSDFIAGANGTDPYMLSSEEMLLKYGPIRYSDNADTNLFDRIMSNDINILDIVIANNQNTAYDFSVPGSGPYDQFDKDQKIYYTQDATYIKPNHSTVLFVNQLDLLDSSWTQESHYDTNANEIVKFIKTIVIENNLTSGVETLVEDTVANTITAMKNGLDTTFVAFTTSLEQEVYPNGFTDEQKHDIINKNGPANILFSQISDLSYEAISRSSQIQGSKITIYRSPSGEIYDDNVLQSIEGGYYGSAGVSNQDIINSFSDLVVSTNDEATQLKIDSLAFILATFGNNVNILPKLNEFRKTFLETSTATIVGRMHEKLEIRLYNANNAVKRGTILERTLNLSPVVINKTTAAGSTYTPFPENDDYEPSNSNNFIYTRNAKLGAYGLPSGIELTSAELDEWIAQVESEGSDLKEQADNAYASAMNYYHQMLVELTRGLSIAYHRLLRDTTDSAGTHFAYIYIGNDAAKYNLRSEYGLELNTNNAFRVYNGGHLTAEKRHQGGHIEDLYLALSLAYLLFPEDGNPEEFEDAWQSGERTVFDYNTPFFGDFSRQNGVPNSPNGNHLKPIPVDVVRDIRMFEVDLQKFREEYPDFAEVYQSLGDTVIPFSFEIPPMLRASAVNPAYLYDAFYEAFHEEADVEGRYTAGDERSYNEAITSGEGDTGILDVLEWAKFAANNEGYSLDAITNPVDGAYLAGADTIFNAVGVLQTDNESSMTRYFDMYKYVMAPDLRDMSQALDYHKDASWSQIIATDTIYQVDGSQYVDDETIQLYNQHYDKAKFAAACNILEVFLQPLTYVKGLGVDLAYQGFYNFEAARLYQQFVKQYAYYIDFRKKYSLYDNILSSFINLQATLENSTATESAFTQYNFYLNGYIFFDYEKAWTKASLISKVLDPNKIDKLFGRSLGHTFFNLQTARAEKLYDQSTLEERANDDMLSATGDLSDDDLVDYPLDMVSRGYVETKFDSNAHLSAVPIAPEAKLVTAEVSDILNINISDFAGTPMGADGALTDDTSVETTTELYGGMKQPSPTNFDPNVYEMEYPYFITRAFELLGEGADNDYRLVCFEFQDVDGPYSPDISNHATYTTENILGNEQKSENYGESLVFKPNTSLNSLLFTVKINDRTRDLMSVLTKQYYDAVYQDFEFYYQSAIEECSFNNSTDKLNEFFINSIIDYYSDDPHLAPWFSTALVYNIHLDLVTDIWSGDFEQIRLAAINETQILSPLNATLADLEGYRQKLRDFYDFYYDSDDGAVVARLNEFASGRSTTLIFGGHPERGGIESPRGSVAITSIPMVKNVDWLAYSAATGDLVNIDFEDIE